MMAGQSHLPKSIFCLNVAYNFTQIILGGVVISAVIIPNMYSFSITSQHIPLCTIGYFILMAQGVMAFSPFGWANKLKIKHKLIVHYTLAILGSIVVVISSALVMANVQSNFSTGHGITGIVAMLLTICTLLGVIPSLIFSKLMYNKFMIAGHFFISAASLCFAFISLINAYHYYYRNTFGDCNANIAIILTVFSLIGTLLPALIKNTKRLFNL